jgi:arylsulfatase A-like enzyme
VDERPNVLVIIADDHRHDAMGCAGDPTVRTPTMDALAARGVRFSCVHHMGGLSQAVCVPARAALLTGCNPFRASGSHVVDDTENMAVLPPDLPTLPEVLRNAGYHTYHVGKWHNDRASFARSFSDASRIFFGGMSDHDKVPLHEFDPSGRYPDEAGYTGEGFSTEMFADAATAFLGRQDPTQPFFLYLAFTSPHDPRTAPEPYASAYDPAAIPLSPNFLPEHPFDNGELSVRDELLAPFPRTPEVVRRHTADYYAMIEHQDAHMARVIAAAPPNTVVVYTADHGLAVGRHGLMGKQNLYDHSTRVPLILAGPGIPEGRIADGLAYTPDLYPTLCDIAGVEVPPTVEMCSLWADRDVVCCAYKDLMRAASDGRWKLIRYRDREQLFHLAEDPHEVYDLAGDPAHQPHADRLAARLADWQRAVGDPWATGLG